MPKTIGIGIEEVAKAFAEFKEHVKRWESSEGPLVIYQGMTTKTISQSVEEAAIDLYDFVDRMEFERSARGAVLAIDRFLDEFEKWSDQVKAETNVDPGGTSEMWSSYSMIDRHFEPRRRRNPEPVHELIDQKVPLSQIAKIYNWFTETGEPDLQRVEREKRKPGSEFDPKKWVHPSDIRINAEIDRQWKSRGEKLEERAPRETLESEDKPQVDAPETVDELILQEVSMAQILKMKPSTTEDEVADRCRALSKQIEGGPYIMATNRDQPQIQDPPQTKEEAIASLLADGIAPAHIVNTLKKHHPTISIEDVMGIASQSV